jgi:hypothetical protein
VESGVIWEASVGLPSCLISWHDIDLPETGKFRVWLVSRAQSHTSESEIAFSFSSLELQNMTSGFAKVSQEEKKARLKLALLANEKKTSPFKSTLFRELPSAQIYSQHLFCIRQALDALADRDSRAVRLVASDEIFTKVFSNPSKSKFEVAFDKVLQSTQADAVIVAKIYSDLSALGARQIVKQISEEFNVNSATIYAALRVARANGYLTSNGSGKSGGRITSLGLERFKESGGEKRIREIRKKAEGK